MGDKELEKYFQQGYIWDKLPAHVRAIVSNNEQRYRALSVRYAVEHRFKPSSPLLAGVNAEAYMAEVERVSRARLMLFPDSLATEMAQLIHVSPFKYYVSMMKDVMTAEKSYDSIPNFTAADAVRLIGIGRNEFIDIMNAYRAKSTSFFIKNQTHTPA